MQSYVVLDESQIRPPISAECDAIRFLDFTIVPASLNDGVMLYIGSINSFIVIYGCLLVVPLSV
jgi:hypothetical protein